MVVSADDIAATLAFVVPGFVALTVFYWLGLRQRRTDWQWLLWSLVVTVPIAWVAGQGVSMLAIDTRPAGAIYSECALERIRAIGPGREIGTVSDAEWTAPLADCGEGASQTAPELRFAAALAVGIAGGLALAVVWWVLGKLSPGLHTRAQQTVWEGVIRGPAYLRVRTDDGLYVGSLRKDAVPGDVEEMDNVDLLLGRPGVIGTDGNVTWLPFVDSMLIRRADIRWVQIMERPKNDQEDHGRIEAMATPIEEIKQRYRKTGAGAGIRLNDHDFTEVLDSISTLDGALRTPPEELRYIEGLLRLPLNFIDQFSVIPAPGSERCGCGRVPSALDLVDFALTHKVHDESLVRDTIVALRNVFEFANDGRLAACHQCGRELRFAVYWKKGYAYA